MKANAELIKKMRKRQSLKESYKRIFNPFKTIVNGSYTMAECRAWLMSRYESEEAYHADHGLEYSKRQYENGFRVPDDGRSTLKPRIPITYDFSKTA